MGGLPHILLATDLTDRSERALDRATQLCQDPRVDKLTLLHVVAAGLPPSVTAQQLQGAEIFLADSIVNQLSHGLRTPARSIVRTGEAFSTIIHEASTLAADLIVVGTPERSPYAPSLAGSTTEKVIRFGSCPVLLVNNRPSGPYARVLVAFDASDGAIRSLAAALAIAPDAKFRIVQALWPPPVSFDENDAARRHVEEDKSRLTDRVGTVVKQATTTSPALSIDTVENNPYVVLSNALRWPDLLVLGTHSKGRVASTASIGSLAQHLLVESACDILISRP